MTRTFVAEKVLVSDEEQTHPPHNRLFIVSPAPTCRTPVLEGNPHLFSIDATTVIDRFPMLFTKALREPIRKLCHYDSTGFRIGSSYSLLIWLILIVV